MIKIERLLTLLASLVVLGVNAADTLQQRSEESDRVAIVAVEKEWLQHETDAASLKRILAEGFVHPVPQGFFLTKGAGRLGGQPSASARPQRKLQKNWWFESMATQRLQIGSCQLGMPQTTHRTLPYLRMSLFVAVVDGRQ